MPEKTPKAASVFDTDQQYLGSVYAKALLSVGRDANKVDQVLEELESFTDAVAELPTLRLTLESPRVAVAEKEQLVEKVTRGKSSDEFRNFLKVLARKGRFECLAAVRSNARRMFNEVAGRIEARVTTAAEISADLQNRIAEQLSQKLGKQVVLEHQIDPQIIGGMVVRVGDTVYDSSVANDLRRVRQSALQRANQQIRESLDRFASEIDA